MSSLSVTLSLAALPLFWVIMSWFGNPQSVSKHKQLIQYLSIFGSLTIFTLLMLLSFLYQPAQPGSAWLKLNGINTTIVTLVMFIGVTLVRYSRNYMSGEACYPTFFRWMKLTLAAVVVTLLSNHLLLLWAGWVAISLSLHRLLLLYPERSRAVLAAHKKFILARLSELLMLLAFALLYSVYHTLYVDELMLRVVERSVDLNQNDTMLAQLAAILIAIVAILKCAQLPFHGWLIKIVEAPTPVSALLHAGIINLGGFLLLIFAPLIAQFSAAQWVLLVAAGMSTFFSALIMTTRVSIKIRLAWSTSSQMGLMLIECALGLYSLALLHLVAHSLYKAFAFLNSGNTVFEHIDTQIAQIQLPTLADWANACLLVVLIIIGCITLTDWQAAYAPWVLLGLSLASLLVTRTRHVEQGQFYISIALTLLLAVSYSVVKAMMEANLVAHLPAPVAALSAMDLWVCGLFITLFSTSWIMRLNPANTQVLRFKQTLYAGLYLDEWFTRITLKLWPVELRGQRHRGDSSAIISRIGSE